MACREQSTIHSAGLSPVLPAYKPMISFMHLFARPTVLHVSEERSC